VSLNVQFSLYVINCTEIARLFLLVLNFHRQLFLPAEFHSSCDWLFGTDVTPKLLNSGSKPEKVDDHHHGTSKPGWIGLVFVNSKLIGNALDYSPESKS